jgi:hypothetical protein
MRHCERNTGQGAVGRVVGLARSGRRPLRLAWGRRWRWGRVGAGVPCVEVVAAGGHAGALRQEFATGVVDVGSDLTL